MKQVERSPSIINDDWRRWIGENLVLGASPQSLSDVLVANGVRREEAEREVRMAFSSPYLQGASLAEKRLQNRLKKHDWVLDIYRTLNRQTPDSNLIERRHQLSRDDFYRQYYLLNKPVIITGMLDDWPAMTKWNFDFFRTHFGEREVEVQMGRSRDANYEINCTQHKHKMCLSAYLEMIESAQESNDFYMTANNSSANRQALAELWQDIGRLPEYLRPDSPDDGFLWLGPKGTRTPFHHDLTNNFMAQVIGRKHIKLIPACEVAYVYNHQHCYTPLDGHAIDYERFPLMRNVQVLDCELAPGELLFLPVGCWHYVEGLDASVTVSLINFLPENDYSKFYSTYAEL
ncbi:cupin-like domain protein [Collimonas arenae]|uniref:Cupin-like domain protein n=1 Tax=Collimonas arenae TaxID=279058 RepID=A0A127PNA5_9BURK|nr:cupin-like domain-containing protein [Collimonas arenae]AMO99290.1 cupin-like domain protein [Collimonas arenae]AMP09194.1 cupin-like domain protein [Collimonas arenae]